jgi:amino acid permease
MSERGVEREGAGRMAARSRLGGLVRGLGPLATTALVVGNMIGSGIYVVPGQLAELAGPLGLVAWAINTAGYLCLTSVFADLGGAYPVSAAGCRRSRAGRSATSRRSRSATCTGCAR